MVEHGSSACGNAMQWGTRVKKTRKSGTIGQYTVRNWIYFPFPSQEEIILYSGKLVTWEDSKKCFGALRSLGRVQTSGFWMTRGTSLEGLLKVSGRTALRDMEGE